MLNNVRCWQPTLPRRLSSGCPGGLGPPRSRREFLSTTSLGFGWLAFSGLATAAGDLEQGGRHLPAGRSM